MVHGDLDPELGADRSQKSALRRSPEARELRLLGSFLISAGGRPITLPRRAARLVALVALVGPLSRVQAAGLLWPDTGQAQASANLRSALMRLKSIGEEFVEVNGDVLTTPESVHVDVHSVMEWVNDTIYGLGEAPPSGPPALIGRELLPGWTEEWLVAPREKLELLQLQALETAAERLLAAGHAGEALPYALLAVQKQPWSESAARLLIETHIRRGDASNALLRFRRFRSVLRSELGVAPSPEMMSLMRQIFPFGLAAEESHRD